ncbi:MAG: ribonuclease P protein component [Flammeovirgaceae bacterium]|nr:ribonuclease P protein component [Flammeovirgaceae bacterium]|tara:strand:+ start:458 stop:832 length:375 start_codon:yes stop_codon:yes gene_type:complete
MNTESLKGQFSFSKEERITNKKIIQKLFNSGEKINLFPFDFRYLIDGGNTNKVLISVSKSKISSSVKRNLIKRRIRESYRLNKLKLEKDGFYLAFIYSSSKILPFKDIKDSVILLLKQLNKINE